MKIGARILKTGVTLVIAIYISQLLHLEPVIFSAIAATLAIQPSIYRSWQYGIEQMQSNLVGATIAILFVFYIGTHPIAIAVAVMLVIGINLQLHFERSIALSIVTVLSIMEGSLQNGNFFLYALDRFLLIFIGVLSALIVNVFLYPPKYERRLTTKLKSVQEQTASLLRIILDRNKNEQSIRSVLQTLENDSSASWELYNLEKETKNYFKKRLSFTSSRKLVILKTMIQTTQFGIEMFHMTEKYQNNLQHLPDELYSRLYQHFNNTATYLDKIYSKFEQKIIPSPRHTPNKELFDSHWDLFQSIINSEQNPKNILNLLSVLSAIREYHIRLDHLDKLIDSYHSYHR